MKTLHKILVLGICTMVFGTCAIAQATDQRGYKLSIAPQPLDTALTDLANQSGVQLAFYPPDCEGLLAPRLEGRYTLRAALEHLLANTPLRYELVNERMVAIRLKGAKTSSLGTTSDVGGQVDKIRLAGAPVSADRSTQASPETRNSVSGNVNDADKKADRSSNEVIVTGTQIRGGAPIGSNVQSFTREDFDRVGAVTAQQFLSTLPQNFGGDYSEDTYRSMPGKSTFDFSGGSGVNLRGLGATSTLVLINGRRVAANSAANYTDISMIPLSAVERIDVLPDGMSTIYGSDAIGGVVNIITRSDYQAAETRLRAGASSRGDAEELYAAQSIGTGWKSGHALLNYEYYSRGALNTTDRSFSAISGPGFAIMPEQERNSAWISAEQSLGNSIRVFGDVGYARREASPEAWDATRLVQYIAPAITSQLGGSLGLTAELNDALTLSVGGEISRSKLDARRDELNRGPGWTSTNTHHAFNSSLTGDLIRLPAGPLKFAFGGMYREDGFEFTSASSNIVQPRQATNSLAVFSEFSIPLIGPAAEGSRTRLALSIAGRYEDYSNFGTTTNPRFGMEWSPIESLRIRASYGTSFKAPAPYQLNEGNASYLIGTSPGVRSLILTGNNQSLHEETASTWSAGIRFAPEFIRGFTLDLNYYDIDYEDKITSPNQNPSSTILQRFREAGLAVQRGDIPDAQFNALVQERLDRSLPMWVGCTGPLSVSSGVCAVSPTTIEALIDARLTNLARTHSRGVDLQIAQHLRPRIGDLELGVNATYIFDQQQKLSPSSPIEELVDTLYRPLAFRMRGLASWSLRNWSATGAVNYSDGYRNTNFSPNTPVSSWTTVDLNVGYKATDGWLNGVAVMLNVQNVFDVAPPFVASPVQILNITNYDPANADPVGCSYSLTLTKQW